MASALEQYVNNVQTQCQQGLLQVMLRLYNTNNLPYNFTEIKFVER